MTPFKLLDLFSGIGGFSLGLERSGAFETVAFCEAEPYCRAVLEKHWPYVPCYTDVRTLTAEQLSTDGIEVDAICGGFPCQDISVAGKGAGIEGERSGLWGEFARLIGEIRPSITLIENVAALKSRGLERVLSDLAALRYDAEWHCIPASYVGAPHRRDRIWIMAYSDRAGCERKRQAQSERRISNTFSAWTGKNVAYSSRIQQRWEEQRAIWERAGESGEFVATAYANREQAKRPSISRGERNPWLAEPNVGRVANGIPFRVDRLKALGNSLVPQIPEIIGLAIKAALCHESA
jgi:DNA (cytosine-5)-methyltransferase 1